MTMPVVDVRYVGMPMFGILVFMLMTMAEETCQQGKRLMIMVVVPFAVPVPMRVDRPWVNMNIRMTIPKEKTPTRGP